MEKELFKEWHPTKNPHIDFNKLTHGSNKKVWWKCSKGHEWQAFIYNRAKGQGCPYCSNKRVCKDNCLATTHPELVKEWSKKNKLKPIEVVSGSDKKIWWKCKKGHKWQEKVNQRSKGIGCPYCNFRKSNEENCLAVTHPELAKEWSYDKNKLKPTEITHRNYSSFYWKCSKGHEWKANLYFRVNGNNCPYCSNRKVCKDNCLATTHPELAKEWSNKNKIKPNHVISGCNKKFWWECKNCKQSWKTKIRYRTENKTGCPYCSNRKISKDNCLATTHPELAKEWSSKNKLKPTEVTCGSKKKVFWKCNKCEWEWKASVYTRKNHGCPKCNESKGEKLVAQVLNKLQIRYKKEYKFKELGQKRFDFALFKKYKKKPWAVIEYHGRQHYKIASFSKNKQKNIDNFNTLQKNDKIKKEYCLDNNIKYLEISYKQKDNIEKLIKGFIS